MPQLTCPHCGLSKEISDRYMPKGNVKVTCPKCQQTFSLHSSFVANQADSEGDLTEIGDLFARSWEIYRQRLSTLIPLYFISMLMVLLPVAVFVAGGYFLSVLLGYEKAFTIAGVVTGALVGSFALFWVMAAVTFAVVDESLGIKAALLKGWSRLGPFIWLLSLLPLIVGGGYFLLIVPGIIFSVLFAFAQYILAAEDVRGMNALLKSREYIRGYGWPVFLRLAVIWAAAMIVSGVLSMAPIIGPLASYFVTPFILIYTVLIYRDLRRIKGDVLYDGSFGAKFLWIFLGSLGYLLLFAALAALVSSHFFTQLHLH